MTTQDFPVPAPVPAAAADENGVERADAAVAREAASHRHTLPVRIAGTLSEVADQPQLVTICALTLVAGLVRRDPRLARTGARMLAAHALATLVKGRIKDSIDRTRPKVMLDEGRYEMQPGTSKDGDDRSFPSGHTAGIVAVARAVVRDYPPAAPGAYATAAAIAAIQVPRGTHYPSDLAAGAAIGLAAEALVDRAFDIGAAWLRRISA